MSNLPDKFDNFYELYVKKNLIEFWKSAFRW